MSGFKEIQDRVTRILSSDLGEHEAREIGFHMADWFDDLEELHHAWHNLESIEDEQLSRVIYRFLAHVPNHLAAAKKLIGYGPIEDIFNVGVLETDEDY